MRKTLPLFAILTLIIFVLACQKEVEELQEIAAKCRITTGYYYGGSGMMNDSAIFTYGADEKLSRVDREFDYVKYFYTGNKITMRRFHEKSMDDVYYMDSIQYEGDNIKRIVAHDYGTFGFDTLRTTVLFSYQGNKLNRITYIEESNQAGFSDTFHILVSTNAPGNIEKLVYLDVFNDPIDSIMYRFDANPNYFRLAHPHFLLYDPFFQLHAGVEPHIPYFMSTNNVIGYSIYGYDDYDVSYELDSNNQVSGVKMDGEDYMRYKYFCK